MKGSLAVQGTEVVFASASDNGTRVGLWRVDTATDTESLLTQVHVPGGNLTVESLGYDGRYVAWIDDRSGTPQVYALDTRDQGLRAITDAQSEQRQLSLDDGVVVWASWGNFTVNALDLDEGIRYPVGAGAGTGPASAPDVHNHTVVWSKSIEGTNFDVVARDLDTGELRRLTYDSMLQTTPHIWGDKVVWSEAFLPSSMREAVDPNASDKPEGARIAMYDLSTNETVHLTPGFGSFRRPVVADGWVAWEILEPRGLAVYNITQGRLGVLAAPTGASPDIALSEDLLAFTVRGPDGLHVYADAPHHILSTQAPPQESSGGGLGGTLVLGGAGLALIVGGVGIKVWRSRASEQEGQA